MSVRELLANAARKLRIYRVLVSCFLSVRELLRILRFFPKPSGFSPMNVGLYRNKVIARLKKVQPTQDLLSGSDQFAPNQFRDKEPHEVALECYSEHKIYPISFSWPGAWMAGEKERNLAQIIPGDAYSFDRYDAYLNHYRGSRFALTFKKGGWDCFRHLEILASGAVPIMPDIMSKPKYTMVHYPRTALVAAWKGFTSDGPIPSLSPMELASNLSSKMMAAYFLRLSGYAGGKVLFVDQQLTYRADYLSVLMLIGLKQLLGTQVEVLHPVDYIYDDFESDVSHLYGRGFGYTRILPADARSQIEKGSRSAVDDSPSTFDVNHYQLVVIGDIDANPSHMSKRYWNMGVSCAVLRGNDEAPTPREMRFLQFLASSGISVFSREIY